MSYVLRSCRGKIIVVDGGMQGDAEYLRGFLAPLGNHVDAWFISHPHPDHVDALTAILKNPGQLRLDHIYASMPDEAWIAEHEPKPPTHIETVRAFNRAVKSAGHRIEELAVGQRITFDCIQIEILGIKNPEITANAINNSGIVFRVADDQKSVLFTGDLGVQGGQKLLKTTDPKKLRADYVQMAHHGQHGVDEDFYKAVQPKYCLWPTPLWLWNNDNGKGKNTGPWQTLIVRQWMDNLNVKQHHLAANGLIRID
jgi:beta-lactamase superfamily II metal-dependent hydrolase